MLRAVLMRLSPCLLAAVAVGCAASSLASPGAWAAPPAPQEGASSAAEPPFEPIRFGDPATLAYDAPFFAGAHYDPSISRPEDFLGQPLGSRIAHHHEILTLFEAWAEESPRVTMAPYAQSFEGRELARVVITSEANQARLDEILANLARLADPRGLSDAEAETIVARTPASAWLGYSIHGDELSGADASLAFGYHLIAGTDAAVTELLDDLVIVLDPVMNPDGRERILGMLEQGMGYVPNLDYDGMNRGRWPHGRGNHYLFDCNRDWMAGVAPETRGRWKAVQQFHPQLFVDAHEMGPLDTYLFYPQAEPFNPHMPDTREWAKTFAAEQAAAFDAQGWSYYTREWADAWYPGYSDSWGAMNNAIGILYEQGGTAGQPVRRASGAVRTYRESVHHQAQSSLANVTTLQRNREALLTAYLAGRRDNVSATRNVVFVLKPGGHPTREAEFVRTLLDQGVEVYRAGEDFEAADVRAALGERHDTLALPAGSWLVPHRQPQSPIVRAFLDPDPRYARASLEKERRDLQKTGNSNIYDVTSWSLVHAYGLDGYWVDADSVGSVERRLVTRATMTADEQAPGLVAAQDAPGVSNAGAPATAWVVDGRDDTAPLFAARAMELGLRVHLADEPFRQAGREFSRWSLVVRREENRRPGGPDEQGVEPLVERAALSAGVRAYASSTSRSHDEGPDLGGGHFTQLELPRIGMVSNSPISREAYGHLWHRLDHDLRLGFTSLDAQTFGWYDLRRFNVLILPPGEAGLDGFLDEHGEALAEWVAAGGTLIACDNAAAAVVQSEAELSDVVLRRDALEDLENYAFAARREREAGEVVLDEGLIWDGVSAAEAAEAAEPADKSEVAEDTEDEDEDEDGDPDAERADAWARRFAPFGVTLRARVDIEHWLTAGCDETFPAFVTGSYAYLSQAPVATPIRLAEAEHLRIAGLLWPEARERLAETAYVTVESSGSGQVILFAAVPGFRGFYEATARLFTNAVLYGPGAGASQPVPR